MNTANSDRRLRRLLALALALAVMVFLGACVSGALADPSEGEGGSALLPEVSPQALEEAQSLDASPVVNPLAAEELPHSSLDRAEAEELLTSVFPASLEEPAGIFDGSLEIEEFHSDHVAVVAPPEPSASPGLLTSLLPLRTEDSAGVKEPVDLGLEKVDGELEPENPLVEVELPATLDEEISLPESGIGIELAGGESERSASVVSGEAAFYPNVATDTDIAAVPTPTGVETFTQLRSPEAPQTQAFRLNIPNGASLEATAAGGAQVKQDGETLMKVQPPTAIDAEGNLVPVDLSVSEDAIHLHVSPGPETAFPLLLDPVYESYSWMNSNSSTGIYSDWRPATSNEALLHPGWIGVWSEAMHTGLNLRSYAGAIAPDARANWFYYVPRYFSDFENPAYKERPTSYIRNMTLSQVYFLIEEGAPVHKEPYMSTGLWDENHGQWVSLGTRYSSEGPFNGTTINLPNPGEYVEDKSGGYTLGTNESASYPRQAFVGQATVEVTDKDAPVFTAIGSPSGWMNQTVANQIPYTAFDYGLGVYSLQVTQPKASGGSTQITTSNQCLGTASNPCPRKAEMATRAISYEPKSMPQGENWLQVTGSDPVGHQSEVKEARVKVDHTAPSLALSGNLTEQAKVGAKLPSYTLNYSASDGDETAPAATAPLGSTGAGTGQMQRPMGVAVDASANIWMVDRENNRVEEFDKNGSFIRQFGLAGAANGQFSNPQGIAVSPAGNVWVTDPGNKRVQEFNEKGEFIRSVTYAGGALGQGKMAEPYAVATGPSETLWVGDVGSHRVYQFQENGTFIRAISSTGPLLQETSLTSPTGIAIDRFGDAYVAEQSSNQILELDSSGKYVSKFSGPGAGQGQLSGPVGLAIAASGNILVADGNDNRIEEFKPDGTFLREFGSLGSESSQLKEPRGIAVSPEGTLLVADAGNHRISKWTHPDKDPQSGAAKVEVKVDAAAAKSEAPGCSTKNCQINGSWTLNADSYAPGSHKVEVIATDAVGLVTTKTLSVETHGDLTAPNVALSGSMTEQATLGTTRPSYKLSLSATDPGSTEERKSGVASTTIKVDGKVVDSTSPGCPAEGCSITREWTLESSAYAVGAHTVEAIATDGAGHTTTKTLTINIARDTTAPALSATSELYVAPEGWIEQKEYSAFAVASDENGYGVTLLELKIDGSVVKNSSGTCSAGGCTKLIFGYINMSKYSGGAHPAELIATDGAGNKAVKRWTINVDPAGHISNGEAAATLEAADETSTANVVGESEEEPEIEGTDAGLGLKATEAGLVATGSAAPTTIEPSAGGSFTVEIPQPESIYGCGIEGSKTKEPEPEEPAPVEPEEPETCASSGSQPEEDLMSVTVTPLGTSENAGSTNLVEENAAVTPNTSPEVDTAVRPLNEGGMIFTAIRDDTAPESYSYRVELFEEQELRLIDDQHAEVFYEEGHPAFTIAAEPAHDAIGTTVPTNLTVDGNDIITLHVHYKSPPEGASFVYPVIAGTGWQGGFETTQIEMPEPPAELEEAGEEPWELEQLEKGNVVLGLTAVGPPEEVTLMTEAEKLGAELNPYEPWRKARKKFRFDVCHPHIVPGDPVVGGGEEGGRREQLMKVLHFHCRDPEYEGNYWWVTVSGRFHFVYHKLVWLNYKEWNCRKSGGSEIDVVSLEHCDAFFPNGAHYPTGKRFRGPIGAMAEWRFPISTGQFPAEGVPNCLTMGGWIFPNPRKGPGGYYEEPLEYQRPVGIHYNEPCPAIKAEEGS